MLKRAMTTMGLMAVTGAVAMAGGFDAKTVPADAKWVLHIDVDAVAKSAFWPVIEQKINANPEFQSGLQQVEMWTGMVLPQDLHGVTVYGLGFNDPDNVVIIKAHANRQQILNGLQMNPSFASFSYGQFDIVSWEDKGKVKHGSFFSDDCVIISDNKENVEKALDTLDGKTEALKAGSAMAQSAGAGVLLGVASDAVQELAKKPDQKNNPILPNMTSAWITLAEQNEQVTLKGTFGAADATKAQQLKATADGLKALALMAASNQNADAKLKAIAPLLPSAEISSQGTNVLVNWTVPFPQLKALAEQLQAGK